MPKQTPFNYLSLSYKLDYLIKTEYIKNLSATKNKRITLPNLARLFRNNDLVKQY